jgi:hypothetical protein
VSRPRFLADHDLKDQIVDGLLRTVPEAEFWRAREFGLSARGDGEVLTAAANAGLIVVSHDVNTLRAHAHWRVADGLPMPGLFLVHQRSAVGPIVHNLAPDLVGNGGGRVAGPDRLPATVAHLAPTARLGLFSVPTTTLPLAEGVAIGWGVNILGWIGQDDDPNTVGTDRAQRRIEAQVSLLIDHGGRFYGA